MKGLTARIGNGVGLRATITTIVALIAALAVLSAILLGGLTTLIRRSGEEMATSALSLRLVEAAEVELLLHARTRDGAVKAAHEGELWRRINQAAEHVTSTEEAAALSRVREHTESYLESSRSDVSRPETDATSDALAAAFSSLEALADVNAQQSRAAAARAASTDRLANALGLAFLLMVAALVGLLLWWLWRRALAPVLGLSAAMREFGAGNRGSRARVGGTAELRRMAEQFNEMADELARQREAQMTFLAGVAHDLRNPLAPLKSAVALLSAGGRSSSGPDTARIVRVVSQQVDYLDRLIGDLLEIARVEAGRLDLHLQEVDARRLAEAAVELFRPVAPDVAFELSTPPTPVPIHCDPVRIQQVLNNLISNAVKYSRDDARVSISVRPEGPHVSFHVRDRGIGIARQDIERLFEPFRRLEPATRSGAAGEGLGLFVARCIVDAHAGALEVSSIEGEGSTFRLRLPAVATSASRASAAECSPAMSADPGQFTIA